MRRKMQIIWNRNSAMAASSEPSSCPKAWTPPKSLRSTTMACWRSPRPSTNQRYPSESKYDLPLLRQRPKGQVRAARVPAEAPVPEEETRNTTHGALRGGALCAAVLNSGVPETHLPVYESEGGRNHHAISSRHEAYSTSYRITVGLSCNGGAVRADERSF